METGGPSSAQIFEAMVALRAGWIKRGWSWDNRISCVASSFGAELTADARKAILTALPHEWDHRSIFQSPPVIQEVSENTQGVRPDQRIYSTATGGRITAFGLWWPWGDDTTISLRIGLAGYVGEADLYRLRDVFNALE